MVCVLLRMTLLVLENQPYAIFFDYTTNKNISFAWKTVYTRAGRALVRGVDGSPGGRGRIHKTHLHLSAKSHLSVSVTLN